MEDNSSSMKNHLHSGYCGYSLHMLVEQLLWGYRTGDFVYRGVASSFWNTDYTIGEDIRDVTRKVSAQREKVLVRKYRAKVT